MTGNAAQQPEHALARWRFPNRRNDGFHFTGLAVPRHRNIQLQGEVITTTFTFVSTTAAIVRCGLTPVFCELREEDYTLDPDKLEALIADKTCAIVPVHVYGNICQDRRICEIARRHDLMVIYDAAHAFGVRYYGRGVGALGDLSMFSLHATKVLNSIEGGLVTYHDEELTDKLWAMQNFGITGVDTVVYIAPNAKMNEFQAAMGICNLRHLNEYIEQRKKVCEHYVERLSDFPGVKLNVIQPVQIAVLSGQEGRNSRPVGVIISGLRTVCNDKPTVS